MTEQELKNLISMGEGYEAEFKVSLPSKVKEVTEEVCAFANAAGGIVLIGVNDRNQVIGCSIDNSKRSGLQNSIGEIDPPLSVIMQEASVDGKGVTVIKVPSGKKKPYIFHGAIYLRVGPNTQKLTSAEEIRGFFQESNKIYFDEIGRADFQVNKDLDQEVIKRFRIEAGLNPAISTEQVLENLQVYTEEQTFKNGGLLFFALNPDKFIESAYIRCVAFKGTDKRYIRDDKLLKGSLISQYYQTLQWLEDKLEKAYEIEEQGAGPRKERWEVPQTVFKEALINSLAHRDYYEKGASITVELFENRIEISNPGGLISSISPSDFGKRSLSRNPLIFGLFARMKMVEKIGSGVTRMKDLMQEAGLPAPVFNYDGMFTVTLYRPVNFGNWISSWSETLTENRVKILTLVHSDPTISKKELSEKIGIGESAIDKNLEYLKEEGLIQRVGPAKGGKWEIIFKNPE